MPDEKAFTYESRQHTRVFWFTDEKGEVQARNVVIVEHEAEGGEPPPTYSRFVGQGETVVDTIAGPVQVAYSIPVKDVDTVMAAFDGLDEAEKAVLPEVVEATKAEVLDKMAKASKKIALPEDILPGPGRGGPQRPFGRG